MFERFTNEARACMVAANRQAQQYGQQFIGSTHILLALLQDQSGAGRVFAAAGVDRQSLTAAALATLKSETQGDDASVRHIIQCAVRESRERSHELIGTEHILRALLNTHGSAAFALLQRVGIAVETLRKCCIERLDALAQQKMVPLEPYRHHPQVMAMLDQLARWQKQKEEAVQRQDFDAAAQMRDLTDTSK